MFLTVCCLVVWLVALWNVPAAFAGDPETTTTTEATTTTTTEATTTTTVPSTTTTTDPSSPPLGEPVALDDVDHSIQQLMGLVGVVGFFVAVHTVRSFGRG